MFLVMNMVAISFSPSSVTMFFSLVIDVDEFKANGMSPFSKNCM